ncbi:MAG: polysaccharide deacetylase family protein [Flavobacteriales bacterium]
MKKIFTLLSAIFALTHLSAQQYTIANWYKNKTACAVLTYDDWLDGHGAIAFDQFVSKGMVGTFYINADWASNSGGYDTMTYGAKHGLEIANHTFSHQDLQLITLQESKDEIKSCLDSINKFVTNQKCLTFAYPFGNYTPDVVAYVKETHIAGRAARGNWMWGNNWVYDFADPNANYSQIYEPYYEIPEYEVSDATSNTMIDAQMTNAKNNGGLLTFMFHEIYNNNVGNPSGWDAVTEQYHSDFLDLIKTYEDDFWIPTFVDAIKYHKERHCATLATVSNVPNLLTLSLTDTLYRNDIYNHPLTLSLNFAQSAVVDSIVQGGNKLIGFTHSNGKLVFNAVPDGGDILVHKSGGSAVSKNTEESLLKELFPNPVSSQLTLVMNSSMIGNYSLQLHNALGEMVYNQPLQFSGYSMQQVDMSGYSAGLYTLSIIGENEQIERKILKVD